jgi:hypothetical protein
VTLLGSDPLVDHKCPALSKSTFDALYPGGDAVYYFSETNELEYDFLVAPGADPGRIRMRLRGMQSLRIAENGDLSSAAQERIAFQVGRAYDGNLAVRLVTVGTV